MAIDTRGSVPDIRIFATHCDDLGPYYAAHGDLARRIYIPVLVASAVVKSAGISPSAVPPPLMLLSTHLISTSCRVKGLLQTSLRGRAAKPMGLAERNMLVAPFTTFNRNSS